MNLDLKTLPAKIQPILRFIKQYVVFVFIIVMLLCYGFLVYQIRVLTASEPSEDAVTEKLQTIQRPKLDQSSLDKIQQLQDQHVEVQTLFTQARDNPFNE